MTGLVEDANGGGELGTAGGLAGAGCGGAGVDCGAAGAGCAGAGMARGAGCAGCAGVAEFVGLIGAADETLW